MTYTDIGDGVSIEIRELDGVFHGVAYKHPGRLGTECEGYVPVNTEDGWAVEQREPLTLSPSLLCRACGHHGWIRNGRWVSA